MEFGLPLEFGMGCQASCCVDFVTCGFLWRMQLGCQCPLVLQLSTQGSILIRPYLEWMGNSVSLKLWQDPQVPLQFQFETDLLFRCDGDVGISFQMKQGI